MPELTLFISHRSKDAALAKALVELCEKALKLPARQIRCTSVDGYRLPVGADTDEQLRREVFESKAFISVITPNSISSAYVLFELGARWGARKHLAPLLARGADDTSLGGPMSGINALRLGERPEIIQLIEDLAEYLERPLEPAASFQDAINRVLEEALKPVEVTQVDHSPESLYVPDEVEIKMLGIIARGQGNPEKIAAEVELRRERSNYHLHKLAEAEFIRNDDALGGDWFILQQPARVFLVDRGLL